jgi:hypothetical protein
MEDLDRRDIDDICRAARVYRLDSLKKDEIKTALVTSRTASPHALSLVPFPRPAHWIRSRRGRLQVCHLGSASTLRHALDRRGRAITAYQQANRSEHQIYHANRNQIPAA